MTRDQAEVLYKTKWWEGKSAREICLFQLFEERLCMPFELLQKAMSEALGRRVFAHEFVDGALQRELMQRSE